jgi:MYXO-CTERM domain-containing protein
VCGCTPTTCAKQEWTCGKASDFCGGTLDCGTCPNGQSCVNNACYTLPDAGASNDARSDASVPPWPPHDSGSSGGGDDSGAGSGNANNGGAIQGGGCSCRVAGERSGAGTRGLLALGAIAGVVVFRSRRRRERRA